MTIRNDMCISQTEKKREILTEPKKIQIQVRCTNRLSLFYMIQILVTKKLIESQIWENSRNSLTLSPSSLLSFCSFFFFTRGKLYIYKTMFRSIATRVVSIHMQKYKRGEERVCVCLCLKTEKSDRYKAYRQID